MARPTGLNKHSVIMGLSCPTRANGGIGIVKGKPDLSHLDSFVEETLRIATSGVDEPVVSVWGVNVAPSKFAKSLLPVDMGWITCRVPLLGDGKSIVSMLVREMAGEIKHFPKVGPARSIFWSETQDGPAYSADYYRAFCQSRGVPTLDDLENRLRAVGGDDFFAACVLAAVKRAKRRDRDCDIDRDWAVEQYRKQRGRCALSGLPMLQDRRRRSPFMPTIDRIDNSGGYTPDNCRFVCFMANLGRGTYDDETYRLVCKAVAQNEEYQSHSP